MAVMPSIAVVVMSNSKIVSTLSGAALGLSAGVYTLTVNAGSASDTGESSMESIAAIPVRVTGTFPGESDSCRIRRVTEKVRVDCAGEHFTPKVQQEKSRITVWFK